MGEGGTYTHTAGQMGACDRISVQHQFRRYVANNQMSVQFTDIGEQVSMHIGYRFERGSASMCLEVI